MDDLAQRAKIVAVARRWIGTPYHHQASKEGVGADCLGLFRGVWRELFYREPAKIPPYTADWTATSGDDPLLNAAVGLLTQKAEQTPESGDIILFRMRADGPVKHLGVLALGENQAPTFIHSYSQRGVVESHLTGSWLRRSAGVFSIPSRSS